MRLVFSRSLRSKAGLAALRAAGAASAVAAAAAGGSSSLAPGSASGTASHPGAGPGEAARPEGPGSVFSSMWERLSGRLVDLEAKVSNQVRRRGGGRARRQLGKSGRAVRLSARVPRLPPPGVCHGAAEPGGEGPEGQGAHRRGGAGAAGQGGLGEGPPARAACRGPNLLPQHLAASCRCACLAPTARSVTHPRLACPARRSARWAAWSAACWRWTATTAPPSRAPPGPWRVGSAAGPPSCSASSGQALWLASRAPSAVA
jgi:hypothetical protein